METFTSKISQIEYPLNEGISGKLIRPSIFKLIQEEFPSFEEDDYLSFTELAVYREKYINLSSIKKVLFDWCFRHQIL